MKRRSFLKLKQLEITEDDWLRFAFYHYPFHCTYIFYTHEIYLHIYKCLCIYFIGDSDSQYSYEGSVILLKISKS